MFTRNRYHYHLVVNPQVVNLTSLAKALVSNLGYHRMYTVQIRPKDPADGFGDRLAAKQIREAGLIDSKVFEEWRALAGCFFYSVLYVHLKLALRIAFMRS